MMQANVKKVYLLLQVFILIGIKYSELTSQPYAITGKVMYSCIVLNFLYMLYYYVRFQGESKIPLALTMTLVADYFLTLMDIHFLLGVFCFFLVQMIYGWEIGFTKVNVFLRVVLLLILAWVIHFLGMEWDFSIVCGLSFATLTVNVFLSWRHLFIIQSKKNGKEYDSLLKKYAGYITNEEDIKKEIFMLALGLILFAGCDLSLGLRIILEGVAGFELLHACTAFMVWIFYLPSQAILTLAYTEFCNNK